MIVIVVWCVLGFSWCLFDLRRNSIPLSIKLLTAVFMSPLWIGFAAAEIAHHVGNYVQFRWEARHGRGARPATREEIAALRRELERSRRLRKGQDSFDAAGQEEENKKLFDRERREEDDEEEPDGPA